MTTTVAVTGAEGFIGSHLVEALVEAGHRVRAMVLYNSFNDWGWLDTLSAQCMANVDVVLGDVRDPGSVRDFMDGAAVVYHLAALIAIPYSYLAPTSYLDTNAGGTLNVLESARLLETPRVVHTSTSEVYGTAEVVPIAETHPLQGQSPYSATKIAADKLVESYFCSFDLPVVTLRPFNTYGPRQSARAVIPTVIGQIAAGAKQVEVGSVSPTRDFNFCLDTASAFKAVGEAPSEAVLGNVFNAGSGTEVSVAEMIQMVGEVMGADVEVVVNQTRVRPDASEVMRLVCDNSRLRSVTQWKPQYSLSDGLAITAQWFSNPANLVRYKTGMYTV